MSAVPAFGRLALRSVSEPRAVAGELIALNLSREVLWTALLLAAVLNTVIFTLGQTIAPAELPAFASSPAILLLFLVSGLVMTVFAVFWAGQALGGTASLPAVLVVVVWLQFLRVAAQVIVTVLDAVNTSLAFVAGLGASGLALWILVNFVAVAHGFEGLGRAAMLLLMAVALMAFGLVVMLSLIGLAGTGVTGDV